MLLAVFLGTHFSHNLQFRGPFGIELAMLFGVPGTLGNRLKTLKGIRFSHFGGAFCRYGFQARSGGGLTLFGSLLGSVLGQKGGLMEYGKTSEKVVEKIQAGNSGYRPCGPLKELKKSANSPGLRPKGGHLKQYKAVPGKATKYSH